jgi:hypothetical protein
MPVIVDGRALSPAEQDKMCRNKKHFRREEDAIWSAIRSQQYGGYVRGRVYRCPVCRGYHVSTAKKTS